MPKLTIVLVGRRGEARQGWRLQQEKRVINDDDVGKEVEARQGWKHLDSQELSLLGLVEKLGFARQGL